MFNKEDNMKKIAPEIYQHLGHRIERAPNPNDLRAHYYTVWAPGRTKEDEENNGPDAYANSLREAQAEIDRLKQ